MYIGSAWNGSRRLLSYWTPSVLKRNLPIYNSLSNYTHNNFILLILEDLGKTGSVKKEFMLSREQIYLDLLFNKYKSLSLNNSPTAGSTLGFKHKAEFGIKRTGTLNPMSGRQFTPEFIAMQKRSKLGINNPQYGVKKSEATIKKLRKLVYVYNYENMSYIGSCVKPTTFGNPFSLKMSNKKAKIVHLHKRNESSVAIRENSLILDP